MIDNIRPVNDDYRSTRQLPPEQSERAAMQGFKSVLNLQSPTEPGTLSDEAEQATAAGLCYAPAPLSPTTLIQGLGPEQPQIQQFLRNYYGDEVPIAKRSSRW